MTISSSLNASVSGLSSNASRLAGISDNIANSATNGYRRIETDFQSMVISNRRNAYAAGGVCSSQQRMIDQSGSLISTNNRTDLVINGRGFLPVSDAAQITLDNGGSPMKLKDQEFSWAGTTSEGSVAPVGPYNFALEGFAKDQSLGVSELASLQTIEEIAQPADDILVTLENGQTLPWKSLTGLR